MSAVHAKAIDLIAGDQQDRGRLHEARWGAQGRGAAIPWLPALRPGLGLLIS